MNTTEIAALTARVALFTGKGESLDTAQRLADKLVERDREGEDRTLCVECRRFRNSRRCAVNGPCLPAKLQRCDAFIDQYAHAREAPQLNPGAGARMNNAEMSLPETKDVAQTTPAKPTRKERLQRFRKDNPRIDYYPSEEAEKAIAAVHKLNAGHSVSAIIDYLVLKGSKPRSGNA